MQQILLRDYEHVPHRRALNAGGESARQVEALRRMGISESEILDAAAGFTDEQQGGMHSALEDSGLEHSGAGPVSLDTILAALNRSRQSLANKKVLVAGPFPPRLLGQWLPSGDLTQLDAPDAFGFAPDHFYHLQRYGLRGVTRLQAVSGERFDVVMAYGAKAGSLVYVAPIVPIALHHFPNAERQMLESYYRLPQMLSSMPAESFRFIPHFLA